MSALTDEQVEKYLSQGCVSCPKCGLDTIEGHSIVIDCGTAEQEMTCLTCEFEWIDHYKLVGIVTD